MNVLKLEKNNFRFFVFFWVIPIGNNRYYMDDLIYNNNEARSLTSLRIAK